ncbi:hypothetical protein ACFVVM_12420 [Nocardia sp. NPDC058176]|uniref:hypothetical protein n=1 Tax=Nocardia sp. NPDC058176 TaxID=3346368 RepID=UPI0036DA3B16
MAEVENLKNNMIAAHAGWLSATVTDDGTGLVVYRSAWLEDGSPLFAPVAKWLADHKHTKVLESTREDAAIEGGTAVLTHYKIGA